MLSACIGFPNSVVEIIVPLLDITELLLFDLSITVFKVEFCIELLVITLLLFNCGNTVLLPFAAPRNLLIQLRLNQCS